MNNTSAANYRSALGVICSQDGIHFPPVCLADEEDLGRSLFKGFGTRLHRNRAFANANCGLSNTGAEIM